MRHSTLTVFVFVLLAGCVVAPPPPPPRPAPPPIPSADAIDHRQRDLEFRVEQGFRTGYINPDDHRMLRMLADDIRRQEREYMNDGVLSPGERQSLSAQQDRLAREVDRFMRR